MKKAITVTQTDIDLNPIYLKNRVAGTTVVFDDRTFPKVWITEDWNKEMFKKRPASVHEEAGFFPVVDPVTDPVTQYAVPSEMFFDADNKVFTWPLHTYTAEELLANAEAEFQDNLDDNIEQNTMSAKDFAKGIFRELEEYRAKGSIGQFAFTDDDHLLVIDLLYDVLTPMADGLPKLTKKRMDAITAPTVQPYKLIYNQVKLKIDNFIG